MLSLLALASSVFWGTSDFFAGLKARTLAPPAVVAITQGFALVALSLILLVRHTGFSPSFTGNGPLWAIAAGLAGALGLVCFYTALASGTMGVVAPISSLGALVPVFLGLLTGEHPSVTAWVGMAVAVTGAALASGPELTGAVPPRPVMLAVIAAACFGTALYCLDRGARYALLETLWGMRVTSVALFLVAGLLVRSVGGTRVRDLPALAVIGLADVTANGLFAFASSNGMVSVASVLGSLYPVATLFWARLLLAERLRRVQSLGVALTLVGVVAIAL
ncbi:MAG TPA: DMT family transporter [Dermatophilaceae bacterium]|jgi:drug/metabolite transporter (DMT)-like permease|nr:DMT family transporter [Dermatophilaceae bacterium]